MDANKIPLTVSGLEPTYTSMQAVCYASMHIVHNMCFGYGVFIVTCSCMAAEAQVHSIQQGDPIIYPTNPSAPIQEPNLSC